MNPKVTVGCLLLMTLLTCCASQNATVSIGVTLTLPPLVETTLKATVSFFESLPQLLGEAGEAIYNEVKEIPANLQNATYQAASSVEEQLNNLKQAIENEIPKLEAAAATVQGNASAVLLGAIEALKALQLTVQLFIQLGDIGVFG